MATTGSINLTVDRRRIGTLHLQLGWLAITVTQNRTGLAAGTYTVTVTDANGCTKSASATITQPAAALAL